MSYLLLGSLVPVLLGNLGPDLMSKDIGGDLSPNVLLLWVVISSSLFLSLSPLTCRYRCSVSYQTLPLSFLSPAGTGFLSAIKPSPFPIRRFDLLIFFRQRWKVIISKSSSPEKKSANQNTQDSSLTSKS